MPRLSLIMSGLSRAVSFLDEVLLAGTAALGGDWRLIASDA